MKPTAASGPDSAFLPDDALLPVAVDLPAGLSEANPATPRPGHASGSGSNWLSEAMAIWLAPEDALGDDLDASPLASPPTGPH